MATEKQFTPKKIFQRKKRSCHLRMIDIYIRKKIRKKNVVFLFRKFDSPGIFLSSDVCGFRIAIKYCNCKWVGHFLKEMFAISRD